ncbi:MAG: hypothetical protein IK090_06380 [Clostridia bacterium]|nr:hypothetical protein [Clostridia bacterium]
MRKTICVLLLLAMLILLLASCGGNKGTDETTAAQTEPGTADDVTTAEATTENVKWKTIASSIGIITEKDRTLRIELSNHGDAEKTSKNDKYVVGPDEVIPGVTPQIEQMVYDRNKAAFDRLHVKIGEYIYWDYAWSKQAEQIKTVVQGNAPDAPDLFVNMISDLNVANLNGVFKNTKAIPNAYFDFTTQGWMSEYMDSLSLVEDRSYVLAGDYFLDVLRALGVLPVNITMMDKNSDKLAPAIIGADETIGEGEKLSARFFDFVETGKWTWDVLGQLCEAIWVDTDNSGGDSILDQLGIVADNYGGLTSEMYIFSASEDDLFDVSTIEDETSEYNGKQWIYYSQDSTALGKIFDAVAAVYAGSGSLSTKGNYEASTPEKPGAAYHRIKFAEGSMLTAGTVVLGALEDEQFQQMEDIFTVVPLPKISEDKHYNTPIHTIGDAGAINVHANPRKARVLSAFLQYCCEHSSKIRWEFLEIVMKYKTTTYDQGTDRMLTLIYDSVITGRDKMIEDCVGTDYRYFWIMMRGNSEVTSADLASQYPACIKTKQALLDKILRTWYELP